MSYIWYTMLNVGDRRRCDRAEIPDQMIDVLRPVLQADGVKQNIIPGLDLVATPVGTMLHATVQDERGVLATFAVALRDRGAAAHWRNLHEGVHAELVTDPETPPSAPWVGLALEGRARQYPREVVHLIVGLTKACAWTWVEIRSRTDA